MRNWHIGLSSWIIQDGNYDDFHAHQNYDFAVEFFPESCRLSSSQTKQARQIKGCKYQVNAEVVQVKNKCWVIDFGFSSYQQSRPPEGIRKGGWVEAIIYLGVDPFFYFEQLANDLAFPPLIHEWHLCDIDMETTPFIETKDDFGRTFLVRDELKESFRTVEQTDAWKDDGGNGQYIFNCELLNRPPKRSRCE